MDKKGGGMSKFQIRLGKRIKYLREGIGMTQQKLAKRLGIGRVALSQIEHGERKLTALELTKLAKVLNVNADVLLGLENEPEVIIRRKRKRKEKKNKIRINVPQKNLEKFKQVLLYILNKVGSKPNIGETVIYKLLYFIDFDYYEKYEEQLIGATYKKNHYGPTPIEFKKIISEMLKEKSIVKVKDEYFSYPRTKYLPLKAPNLSQLKAAETEVIDNVLGRLSDMNAAQISEYSHNDVPWLTTEKQGIIEYESVFYRTRPYSVRKYSEEISKNQ
jgi:transcriptional regulator with XRE-family HTH domain